MNDTLTTLLLSLGGAVSLLLWVGMIIVGVLAFIMPIVVLKMHFRLTRMEDQAAALGTLAALIGAVGEAL